MKKRLDNIIPVKFGRLKQRIKKLEENIKKLGELQPEVADKLNGNFELIKIIVEKELDKGPSIFKLVRESEFFVEKTLEKENRYAEIIELKKSKRN